MSSPVQTPPPKPAATPLLLGIDRLVLRVPNLPAAVKYYGGTLGLSVVREGQSFATLRLGDGREVLLHNDADLPEEAIFLRVADVRRMYADRDALRLRFQGLPTRVARGFKATVKDPFGTVLLLLDRDDAPAEQASAPLAPETAATPHALFPGVEAKLSPKRRELAKLYESAGRTADDLPYTPQFETIHAAYAALYPEPQPARGETWRHLLLLRKRGELPKLGAAKSTPPVVDPTVVALVHELIGELFGGKIGRRDRLPYSADFDALTDAFNERRVRDGDAPLAPHQLWRLVASIAK